MERHRNGIIMLVGGLAFLSMFGCSVGRQIVKGPNTPTATPTPTRRPTFTATASATPMPPVTNTPLPTDTPQAVAVVPPTEAPEVGGEAAPPTNTPEPEPPTNTPKPPEPPTKAPAPPPPPTDTPVPQPTAPPPTATPSTPYVGRIVTGFANCGSTGLFGYVKTTGGGLVNDVYIHVWTDNWDGEFAQSDDSTFGGDPDEDDDNDRNYELPIAQVGVVGGSWHVAIVDDDDADDFKLLSPVYEITTSQNCEGDGAVQWVHVDFTKNY